MPLDLPRVLIRTDSFDPVVVDASPEVSPAEVAMLAALDRAVVANAAVDRCVPLPGRRWAIGQRRVDDTVWRVVGAADIERLGGHPAWLWTAETWFDPAGGRIARGRAPAALPLRHLVRLMAPLGGRNRRTIKAIAAVIAAIRAQTPVALLVEPDLLASASRPARWFVLGLMAILPPGRREQLRVSIGDPNPPVGSFDLAVCAEAHPGLEGYTVVRASEPPDEGDDLVAYYVRNRLYDDDPEALEAAAYLFDGDDDRWGDGIAALIRDGLPGVSEVTAEMIEADPERAVRALAARLRAGAPLDPPVVEQLVSVTLKTRDPRPWRPLGRRPPLQRADAVDALLAHAAGLRPNDELVLELAALYPRGAPLERWLPTLLGWIADGIAIEAVVDAVQSTLLEWPVAETGPTRDTVWRQVVAALVGLGRAEQAARSLVSPLAAVIARAGDGRTLVEAWGTVPRAGRVGDLGAFVALLWDAPKGEELLSALFAAAVTAGDGEEARAIVQLWVDRARGPVPAAVAPTPYAEVWQARLVALGLAHPPPPTQVSSPPTLVPIEREERPPPPAVDAPLDRPRRTPSRTPPVLAIVEEVAAVDAVPVDEADDPDNGPPLGATDPITEPVAFDVSDEVAAEADVLPSAEAVWDDVTEEPPVPTTPYEKLLELAARASAGAPATGALALAGEVLSETAFPDDGLAAAAELLAHTAEASPLWAWLAVVASGPGAYDDATIDATVVDFATRELDADTLSLATVAVERLGEGARWEPLDHARWIVRFALAPRGRSNVNVPMVVALLRGVRARRDAVPFMAGVLRPMLELPPDHKASMVLVDELVAGGWHGEGLQAVIDAVGRTNLPLTLRRTLLALAGAPAVSGPARAR